ncbi:MAG: hypothetical protein N2510_07175 [Ignavibacteria bacterium]|nr:hypothetical protein [Ignavibacteria bacterium]
MKKEYLIRFKMYCEVCEKYRDFDLVCESELEYYLKKDELENANDIMCNMCPECDPSNPRNKLN